VLIAFGGLPGTGKTTLARTVASRYAAVYLRIDTIEQAIQDSDVLRANIGAAGYVTAYRVAADNLRVGRSVVGDAVNPLTVTRDSWAEVARLANVCLVEVEVICSDVQEHKKRVESRNSDIEGRPSPTWEDVIGLKFEPWKRPHIIIDTARKSIVEVQDELMRELLKARHSQTPTRLV
jgi:predicted kinase